MEDLGFGVLIKEIEKRFGKTVIDIVLMMAIMLAVLLIGKHIIDIILHFETTAKKGGYWAFYGVVGRLVVVVTFGFCVVVVTQWWMRRKIIRDVRREITEHRQFIADRNAEFEEALHRYERIRDHLDEKDLDES